MFKRLKCMIILLVLSNTLSLFGSNEKDLRYLQSNYWKTDQNSIININGSIATLLEIGADIDDTFHKGDQIFACLRQDDEKIYGRIKTINDSDTVWKDITFVPVEDTFEVYQNGLKILTLHKTTDLSVKEAELLEYLLNRKWIRTSNNDNSIIIFEDNCAIIEQLGTELPEKGFKVHDKIIYDLKKFGKNMLIGKRILAKGSDGGDQNEEILLRISDSNDEIFIINNTNDVTDYLVDEKKYNKIHEGAYLEYLNRYAWQDWDGNIYQFLDDSIVLIKESSESSLNNFREYDTIVKDLKVENDRIIGLGNIKDPNDWEVLYLDPNESRDKLLITNNLGNLYLVLEKQDYTDLLKPILIYPADNSSSVPIVTELRWDYPAEQEGLEFDIYLGNEPDPILYTGGISDEKYVISTLKEGETYYWKIVANTLNGRSESKIQSFSTSSNEDDVFELKIFEPSPKDGENGVGFETKLQWNCTNVFNDTIYFDVFLGTTAQPKLYRSGLKTNSCTVTNLTPNTTYYWKVIARGTLKMVGLMNEPWEFTTGNGENEQVKVVIPLKYYPLNHAQNISTNPVLSWYIKGETSDSYFYDVYFGVDINPPIKAQSLDITSFEPKHLQPGTKYYWKVNAKDDLGKIVIEGPLSDFITESK